VISSSFFSLSLAKECRVDKIQSLLRDNPDINVNWAVFAQWTALHAACWSGQVEVVKLLLAHPDINVNLKDNVGQTPFSLCCERGHVSVVQVLLKDPRVDVTLDDDRGRTPLWYASYYGKHEVIEWLIASGRDLGDIENKKVQELGGGEDYTALEIAREFKNKTEVVSVLERFIANPTLTRHELRVKLGALDEVAAEVFALTVFLFDDLLQLKPANAMLTANPASAAATRFFASAAKLPMELQMILCHRAVGSMKQNIHFRDSEAAFKSLARILLSQAN